ncbi:hypothetical protein DFO83_1261 [Idiomarina loihiensis]|uniref:hypothetical protein n=1 Tax=Idiomarina TaxID=135575 RepID=UPI000D71A640|nr:hypothetical protein [Idiomarina]PWW32991.1 hypothetical protein DFO83_1261 [Idiomarina loihiensis]TDP43433.1 hypothetical protein DET58_1251 [Idiomarina loihiensis]TDS18434.1 hypothetical protein DET62_1251 [Idiomarina sp. H2]
MEDITLLKKGQLAEIFNTSVSSIERMMRDYNRLYKGGYESDAKRCCPSPVYFSGGGTVRFSVQDISSFLNHLDDIEVL